MQCVGQTGLPLKKRFDEHYRRMIEPKKIDNFLYRHFKRKCHSPALLKRCYTQHALRVVNDSKINHIRHFIKIPFINKGMDFIVLPSIFRDKSVQSSMRVGKKTLRN